MRDDIRGMKCCEGHSERPAKQVKDLARWAGPRIVVELIMVLVRHTFDV